MIPDSDLIDFLAKGCLPERARLRQEKGLLFNGPDGGDQDDVEAQQVHVHPDHQGAQAHCKSGVQHPEHNERGRLMSVICLPFFIYNAFYPLKVKQGYLLYHEKISPVLFHIKSTSSTGELRDNGFDGVW